jgi:hypothetical protein
MVRGVFSMPPTALESSQECDRDSDRVVETGGTEDLSMVRVVADHADLAEGECQ